MLTRSYAAQPRLEMIAFGRLNAVMRSTVKRDHSYRAGEVEDLGAARRIAVAGRQHGRVCELDLGEVAGELGVDSVPPTRRPRLGNGRGPVRYPHPGARETRPAAARSLTVD